MDKAVMSVRMQKWAGIIQEAALSGMTKTEFCEQCRQPSEPDGEDIIPGRGKT